MPAYNFKPAFAPLVEAGTKKQTVRKVRRKRPTQVGDRLVLYTAMRTKQCRLLRFAICCSVLPLRIHETPWDGPVLEIDGIAQGNDAADAFAYADGFESFENFVDFFRTTYGLPFEGEVIRWY